MLLITFTLACTCSSLTPALPTLAPTLKAAPTISDGNRTRTQPPTLALAPTATLVPALTPAPSLFIPPGCENIKPATVLPATAAVTATSVYATNQPINAQKQMRVLEALVKKVEEVYVYENFNGKDWKAIAAKYREKVRGGLTTENFYQEMRAMITDLGDDHSNYEAPQQVAQQDAQMAGSNNYTGIGVLIQPMESKSKITVLMTFPGSSAEKGGLKPHDSIVKIDGRVAIENGTAYSQRLRGPECSAVNVTVVSPNGQARDVLFIRHKITSSQPINAQLVATKDGSKIGYIFLPTFIDETISDQVDKALKDFGNLDGLILDNRMNEGGSGTVLEKVLSYFTSGLLGHFQSRKNTRSLIIKAHPIHNSQTVPLVVLISRESVSYGEVFPGVLQDSGRAKLVGDRTAGNVETLYGYDFEDGSRAWIAHETFVPLNSKKNWESVGVKPDVEVIADWDTFTFENDPGIAAALKIFGHK
jgi:C-terminal peptidase prc